MTANHMGEKSLKMFVNLILIEMAKPIKKPNTVMVYFVLYSDKKIRHYIVAISEK